MGAPDCVCPRLRAGCVCALARGVCSRVRAWRAGVWSRPGGRGVVRPGGPVDVGGEGVPVCHGHAVLRAYWRVARF